MANVTHHRHSGMGMCPCRCSSPAWALPPALGASLPRLLTAGAEGSGGGRALLAAVALLGAARVALGMRNVVGQLFPWCWQPGSAVLPQRPGHLW